MAARERQTMLACTHGNTGDFPGFTRGRLEYDCAGGATRAERALEPARHRRRSAGHHGGALLSGEDAGQGSLPAFYRSLI